MNWNNIPNGLVLAVASTYYAYGLIAGTPLDAMAWQTAYVAIGLVVMATVGRAAIPAGVAKLSAAMFLWMTFSQAMAFLIITGLGIAIGAFLFPRLKDQSGNVAYLPFAIAAFAITMAVSGLQDLSATH